MSKLSYAQRAANGAALLDQHQPGWAQRVDIDTLNVVHGLRCPLGQVFGSWSEGLDFLTDASGQNVWGRVFQPDHGFNLTSEEYAYDDENGDAISAKANNWLIKRWAAEVKKRKEL